MNIKPTYGHAGRTTLRGRQTAPKYLIDLVQFPANQPHGGPPQPNGSARRRVAKAFDYNVHGAASDIGALLLP